MPPSVARELVATSGPKQNPAARRKSIELIQNHACADAHGAIFHIEFPDLPVMPRKINDQPVADRAAAQAGSGAARDDTDTPAAQRGLNDGAAFLGCFRKGDRRRHDLIRRSVRRVKLARAVVKRDSPFVAFNVAICCVDSMAYNLSA